MSPSIDSLTLWTTVALAITLSLAAKRLALALGKPQAAAAAKAPSAVSSFSGTCCPICLEAITEAECRLECGHVFHETCLKRWFQVSSVCPYRCNEPPSPREPLELDEGGREADATCFALSAERCRAARAAYRRCLGW